MSVVYYLTATVAVVATLFVIGGRNPVRALLCLVVSLLSVAILFFLHGAPFAAALEVIIYAGAIMVLFVFAIMMLNIRRQGIEPEWDKMKVFDWAVPVGLGIVLLGEIVWILIKGMAPPSAASVVTPRQVGMALFGSYWIATELIAMLLLAALIGAYVIGRRKEVTQGGRSC